MPKKVNIQNGEHVALFNSIAIEIASRCNRHCHFCPNAYFDRVDQYMPLEMIYKIISDLKSINYAGRLEWYIYNEPTRDKRLAELISYARKELPRCCQMINTNGDYFKTVNDIQDLFEAGLNQMQINVYSSSDDSENEDIYNNGVRLAQKRQATLQGYIDSIKKIEKETSLYLNIGHKRWAAKVVPKFGISKFNPNKALTGFHNLSNRAGNISEFIEPKTLNKPCTKPFRFLNINFNGDAIVCCNDYYGETNCGNVNSKSLVEIWNSYEFNLYRLKLQNKKRDCFLCNNCDFNGGYYPHMCDTVTFGEEKDKELLDSNLIERSSIFGKISLPIAKQGTKI